jgi:hypothetical protein
MKKKRQFLKDLYRNRVVDLPFIELFQTNIELRNILFDEYLKTDIKPDLSLYLNKFYTDKEIEQEIIKANNKIPNRKFNNMHMADFVPMTDFEIEFQRIKKEFYSFCAKNEIPKDFCKHSISETCLMKELESINTSIIDFNLYISNKTEYNAKEYAEAWSKNLIHKLESLDNPLLTELILRDFINNGKFNESRFDLVFDHKYEADAAKSEYRELSMYANNIINDYLKALPPQLIFESPFSVLEWATIFYYADETKLLPENRTIKKRMEQFINKYEINTTFKYFRTQYYKAKKRINEKNDYPINKLESIIPFLKENYQQTVTKVENDIIYLEENQPEY